MGNWEIVKYFPFILSRFLLLLFSPLLFLLPSHWSHVYCASLPVFHLSSLAHWWSISQMAFVLSFFLSSLPLSFWLVILIVLVNCQFSGRVESSQVVVLSSLLPTYILAHKLSTCLDSREIEISFSSSIDSWSWSCWVENHVVAKHSAFSHVARLLKNTSLPWERRERGGYH